MSTRLQRLFPILEWAPRYTRGEAVNDLFAAVIVSIMLVPQSLAYAMLAGLPPVVGLYASILPLIAYAVFGTSRTLAVGPVAVVSLMTAAALAPIAVQGTAAYLAAAVTLAFLSGLILVVMAVLRLGFLANFLSHPVISGFITASGILIAASQVKHILGIRAEGDTLPRIVEGILGQVSATNIFTLLIGVSAVAFLFWVRKQLKPRLIGLGLAPRLADLLAKAGPLAAIVVSILLVVGFGLDRQGCAWR